MRRREFLELHLPGLGVYLDFSDLKTQFGLSGIRSADFDYNNVVNILDFTIQKGNFGQAGRILTCP